MVKVINGKQVLTSDLEKIASIFNERMVKDYSDLKGPIKSNFPNELRKDGNKYTIYLGDDWYLVFKRGLFTIEFIEMVASKSVTPKRNAEMLKVIREVIIKYKNHIYFSDFRCDTTYKVLSFLSKKNYIKVYCDSIYSIHPNLTKRDEMVDKVIHYKKLDDADYKYIMHHVAFSFKKDFKEKKLC